MKYSTKHNRSRIDLYGGTISRYYYGMWYDKEDEEHSSKIYMIHPRVSEDDSKVLVQCDVMPNWDDDQKDFLPSIEDFTYSGTQEHDGKQVQVWTREEPIMDVMIKKETLLVAEVEDEVGIPLHHYTKVFNFDDGSLDRDIVVNYYNYDDKIPARVLDAESPGSTKPAEIPRSQLKYLFFMVQGDGQRQKYSYWTANQIANDPKIDFRRKTVLIVLGYLDSSGFPIAAMFAHEYEDLGYNVIILDNQRFATVHYYLATRLMRPVGRHVAEVLAQLTQHGLDPAHLELLGFSLGGQTASFIGSHFQLLTGRNVSRITALEPSGPCFRTLGPKERLDASDADFVDVIHTNIDGFGMATRMGHADFYVNGGEYQPSDVGMFPCTVTCSHFRVLSLWIQALRHPRKFIALKCDNIQQARASDCYKRTPLEINYLGLNVDKGKQGIYYLSTDKSFPFYLGEDGLKPEFVYWKRISNVNDGNRTEIYT